MKKNKKIDSIPRGEEKHPKILIIQQKMIGDVLTTAMLFEVLRKKYPTAQLHYLINSHTLPVVKNNPFLNTFVLFTPKVEKSKIAFFRFIKIIRRERYDAIIDVYSKWSSAFISRFSKAEKTIGKKKWYLNWAYSHPLILSSSHKGMHIPTAYAHRFEFLKPLMEDIDYSVKPKIFLSKNEKNEIGKKLEKLGLLQNVIMVSCLGSDVTKTYPLEYLAILLDELVKNFPEKKLMMNAMPSQEKEVSKLLSLCSPETRSAISDFQPKGLREFIVVTSFCEAVIGNEGGAINMAKALGVPTFAIFSPWIGEEAWGHENISSHVNIHLKKYHPELFDEKDKKELKKEALDLYKKFNPGFFSKRMISFLENNRKA